MQSVGWGGDEVEVEYLVFIVLPDEVCLISS